MREKSTGDLSNELMGKADLNTYLKRNRTYFRDPKMMDLLDILYQKNPIPKAELARQAGMSEVYLHQILSGRRKPSRDRLLCICIGLDATLDETQDLLKQAVYAQLYPKHKRDVIISYGIVHHMGLQAINDKLFDENEKTLF